MVPASNTLGQSFGWQDCTGLDNPNLHSKPSYFPPLKMLLSDLQGDHDEISQFAGIPDSRDMGSNTVNKAQDMGNRTRAMVNNPTYMASHKGIIQPRIMRMCLPHKDSTKYNKARDMASLLHMDSSKGN